MTIKCPKCNSDQISGGTQGFGAGKAVAGALVAGPLGLAAGAINKNKTVVHCLSCGNRWKPAPVQEPASGKDSALGALVMFVVALVVFFTYSLAGFWWAVLAGIIGFIVTVFAVAVCGDVESDDHV